MFFLSLLICKHLQVLTKEIKNLVLPLLMFEVGATLVLYLVTVTHIFDTKEGLLP